MSAQHPEYLGVWCPTCKQDCLPIHGRCGFCNTPVEPGARTSPKETPVNECKIDGCTNRAIDTRGPYAKLCPAHKSEKIESTTAASKAAREALRGSVKPPPVEKSPTPNGNGHAPLTLTELAQAVDDAASRLTHAREDHARALTALRAAIEAH